MKFLSVISEKLHSFCEDTTKPYKYFRASHFRCVSHRIPEPASHSQYMCALHDTQLLRPNQSEGLAMVLQRAFTIGKI
jgi:hypothetical protein